MSKVTVGNYNGHGNYESNAILDEVRFVDDSCVSDDWINQSYQIVANQESYVTFGSEVMGVDGEFIKPNTSQEFMGNETVEIEYNETNLASTITNVTFSVNGSVYQGLNNTASGDDYWVYNYTIPDSMTKGNLSTDITLHLQVQ